LVAVKVTRRPGHSARPSHGRSSCHYRGHQEGSPPRLVWSDIARQDFRKIFAYIAERNPPAAATVADWIDQAARDLAAMPTGRAGRVSRTYEKSRPGSPYIRAYALETTSAGDEVLAVLRVIHGARNWPAETPAGMTGRAMANCAAEERAVLFLPLSGPPFASAAGI
jgi:plasmid stabilization system protein ParE